jgi:hypothetical protein
MTRARNTSEVHVAQLRQTPAGEPGSGGRLALAGEGEPAVERWSRSGQGSHPGFFGNPGRFESAGNRYSVEVLDFLRFAGSVFELLGCVAEQDQEASPFQNSFCLLPAHFRARSAGALNCAKISHTTSKAASGYIQLCKSPRSMAISTPRSRASAAAFSCAEGEVLLGEPDPVSCFAVRDRQHPAGFGQQILAGSKEIIRFPDRKCRTEHRLDGNGESALSPEMDIAGGLVNLSVHAAVS